MRRLILVFAAALFAIPALAQQASKADAKGMVSTQDFVDKAAISDMFEIQSSQLAVQKSSGETRDFAQQMITDHQMTTDQLTQLVKSGQVEATLPQQMDQTHQDMLNDLKSLEGDAFTQKYQSLQIEAHRKAVDLFGSYAQNGDNQSLSSWAGETRPKLETHLQKAQALTQ